MDDISIKILDALFDMCEGENYAILDVRDLTDRIPDYVFEPDELNEILETLHAEELLDLKYADETEICVALKMKGRSLIKQLRDRLQKAVANVEAATASDEAASVDSENGESRADEPSARVEKPIRRRDRTLEYEQRTRSVESVGPRPVAPRDEEEEKKMPLEKKVILFASLGAAAGAVIVNLIWLILFLLLK